MPSGRNYQEDIRRARDQRTEGRKGRDVDVRNANEMRTVEEANKRLMNQIFQLWQEQLSAPEESSTSRAP